MNACSLKAASFVDGPRFLVWFWFLLLLGYFCSRSFDNGLIMIKILLITPVIHAPVLVCISSTVEYAGKPCADLTVIIMYCTKSTTNIIAAVAHVAMYAASAESMSMRQHVEVLYTCFTADWLSLNVSIGHQLQCCSTCCASYMNNTALKAFVQLGYLQHGQYEHTSCQVTE